MPDLQFLQSMMGVMQQAQRSDGKQEALLCALKPFLRPERREGIDRAMQLAKLSQLAGIALKNGGLMGIPVPEKIKSAIEVLSKKGDKNE